MTQDVVANPWAAKARALDRYRWLLLRERHGLLGSALRFGRELAGDWLFGWRAKRRLAAVVAVESFDFLLLQSAPKVIKFQRKKLLIEELRVRGHSLMETALEEPKSILRQRLLKRPPYDVPIRYFGHAAYAEWLVERYQPRILLNDRNGSLYAPFLRLALNARQRLLVQLAHASTVESSRRLGMNDYDYYFLFGQSSLDALQARHLRFGSSQAVLAGSHMVDDTYDLLPAEPSKRTVLILGVGPDKEKESGYQATYALLRDWAAVHPEYQVLIKAHPRSQVPFWQEATARLANLQVLPADCTLAEALGRASLVINIMSNAVIEAALARRPLIYVNASGEPDIFAQEAFFGQRVERVDQLQQRIAQIAMDYPNSLQQSARFADHHLAHGVSGLVKTVSLLEELQRNNPIESQSLSQGWVAEKTDKAGCCDGVDSAMSGFCFEHAFVINLDHRTDRWARMTENLTRVGIAAERFSAISVRDLTDDPPSVALRAFLQRVDGPSPVAEHKLQTTWACMRSHLAIIQMAREAGWPSVLILEDDCEFETYTRTVLTRASKQLQGCEWGLLYLGGTFKKGGKKAAVSTNLWAGSRIRLAHAYVVDASLYERILCEAPESGLPLDWYYSEILQPSINTFVVRPILAQQRLLDMSDIEQVERKPKHKTRQTLQRWWAKLRYGRSSC
ncbi:glycosyltransferase family 25 protein [Pseudomonas sp. MAC6]|uniref:glycosyltransferase family 25 protein n=1 Tax=Pseudomonas sp. MAC6 TaxID=3401633 RepID=UPI003BF46C78